VKLVKDLHNIFSSPRFTTPIYAKLIVDSDHLPREAEFQSRFLALSDTDRIMSVLCFLANDELLSVIRLARKSRQLNEWNPKTS
jgi:hypothetical protein